MSLARHGSPACRANSHFTARTQPVRLLERPRAMLMRTLESGQAPGSWWVDWNDFSREEKSSILRHQRRERVLHFLSLKKYLVPCKYLKLYKAPLLQSCRPATAQNSLQGCRVPFKEHCFPKWSHTAASDSKPPYQKVAQGGAEMPDSPANTLETQSLGLIHLHSFQSELSSPFPELFQQCSWMSSRKCHLGAFLYLHDIGDPKFWQRNITAFSSCTKLLVDVVSPYFKGSTGKKEHLPLRKYNGKGSLSPFSLKDKDYCPHLDVQMCIRKLPKVTKEDHSKIKNKIQVSI